PIMKNTTLKIKYLAIFFALSFQTLAASEIIALDGKFLPAADLLDSRGNILTSEEAKILGQKVDLSTLSPRVNDIWNGRDNLKSSDDIITSGRDFNFSGAISSQSGLLRFNVRSSSNERFVISLSKEAHSIML